MAIRTALADTYIESYGQLRNVASRFVQQDEADDMVQEAYVRALARGDEFRGESTPTTWLYRILVNACLDVRRYRQRRGVHVTLEETRSAPRGRRVAQAGRPSCAPHRAGYARVALSATSV